MMNNNEINAVINQAKSDAKKDAIKQFFKQNSKVISTISMVLVGATIAYGAFAIYQNSQETKFSEVFHQALIDQQMGNVEKAKEELQQIYNSSAPKGIQSLASLRYAAILFDENKKAEAAAIYQRINECGSCDVFVRDLGGLLAIKTWIADENELQKEDLLTRVEAIENRSKELRYQISEQKAFIHLQKNNLAKAYETLDAIAKSPEASQSVKVRASEGLRIIVSKGYVPQAEAAAKSVENQK